MLRSTGICGLKSWSNSRLQTQKSGEGCGKSTDSEEDDDQEDRKNSDELFAE